MSHQENAYRPEPAHVYSLQPAPDPTSVLRIHAQPSATAFALQDPQVTVRLHPSEEQVAVASRHLGELSDPLAPADPSPAHHRDPSRTPEPVLANGHSKEHKQKKRHRKVVLLCSQPRPHFRLA